MAKGADTQAQEMAGTGEGREEKNAGSFRAVHLRRFLQVWCWQGFLYGLHFLLQNGGDWW